MASPTTSTNVSKPKSELSWAWALGAGGLLALLVVLFTVDFTGGKAGGPATEKTVSPAVVATVSVPTPNTAMLHCSPSSSSVQQCAFEAEKTWVGLAPNLELCLDPLPQNGNYTLWLDNGQMWTPGMKVSGSAVALVSNDGSNSVKYASRPPSECPATL